MEAVEGRVLVSLYTNSLLLKTYTKGNRRGVDISRRPSALLVLINDCTDTSRRKVGACHFGRRAKRTILTDALSKVRGPSFLIPARSNARICTIKRARGKFATGTLTLSALATKLALLGDRSANKTSPYCVAIDPSNGFILATGCVKTGVAIFPHLTSKGLKRKRIVSFRKGKTSGRQRRRPRLRYICFAPSKGLLLTGSLNLSHVRTFPMGRASKAGKASLLSRTTTFSVRLTPNSNPHRAYFSGRKGRTCLLARLSNRMII